MYCIRKITDDITYIGGSDRRLALFENVYPIPNGVSYNAYFIDDEKNAVLDTVDKSVSALFFENIAHILGSRTLDYVIVNHMEPDHAATLEELVLRYPQVKIVCNAKSAAMMKQFFSFDADAHTVLVKEGDTLSLGKHTLSFYMAPMVHWPEVMVTYDETEKVLFSADAFGTFGALNGNIFADELPNNTADFSEARRYYTNIVGKYGAQTLALLKKVAGLDMHLLCPLHGPVWRKDIAVFVEKYLTWGAYAPEQKGVLIVYGSVYGGTQNAAEILAAKLSEKGVPAVLYDASVTHTSYLVSEAFRYSHLVFAAATYNNDIFTPVETLLTDLKAHALRNRTVGLIQNGSWAPQSGKKMREILESMQNMTVLPETVTVRSTVKEESLTEIDALCGALIASLRA
ncbi:MAG: FprA family A-type flavoprotein [Lachnospiraceae bacterium]